MSEATDLAQELREIAQRREERSRMINPPSNTIGSHGQSYLSGEASGLRKAAEMVEDELA